jgi:hypothetical protein
MIDYLGELRAITHEIDVAKGSAGPGASINTGRLLCKLELLVCRASFAQETRENTAIEVDWAMMAANLRQERRAAAASSTVGQAPWPMLNDPITFIS